MVGDGQCVEFHAVESKVIRYPSPALRTTTTTAQRIVHPVVECRSLSVDLPPRTWLTVECVRSISGGKEPVTMREAYHEQIDQVTGRLMYMSRQVAEMIRNATDALLTADIHEADAVVTADASVDQQRTEIEEALLEIIATQAPVAGELRHIVASIRITQALERMGDLATHVAKVARMRYPESAVPPELRTTFTAMGVLAERMATKAGVLMRVRDAAAAERMRREDDEMDRLHKGLFLVILDDDWPYSAETAVDQALLGRYYERFADHAVSIAAQLGRPASS
jgi:phosphate transport system protein